MGLLSYWLKRVVGTRTRRYPIKRNKSGLTARQQCFRCFDADLRPAQAARIAGVSARTARRYRCDWAKLPGKFTGRYKLAKQIRKKVKGFKETTIETLARELRVTEQHVRERLEKPWAVHQLLRGKWAEMDNAEEEIASEAELRLQNALELIHLFEINVPDNKITEALDRVRAEHEAQTQDNE